MQNSTPLAWLIGNEGTPDEIRYELVKSESTLGRGSDCEVQVDDKLASRKHALIYYRGGNFEIEDLGYDVETLAAAMEPMSITSS